MYRRLRYDWRLVEDIILRRDDGRQLLSLHLANAALQRLFFFLLSLAYDTLQVHVVLKFVIVEITLILVHLYFALNLLL